MERRGLHHPWPGNVRDENISLLDKQKAILFLDALKGTATAYVDPKNSRKAVLRNALAWNHFSYLMTYFLIGILLSGTGILLFLFLHQ